jgi:hypothetical protein
MKGDTTVKNHCKNGNPGINIHKLSDNSTFMHSVYIISMYKKHHCMNANV